MKLKFLLVGVLILFSSMSPALIHAQGQLQLIENEEMLYEQDRPADVSSSQALEVTFKEYVQNPSSKVARFEMVLKSNVNSDRVRVTWTISGQSIAPNEDQLIKNLTVRTNETYIIPIDVKPLGYGVTEVYGVARIVGADSGQVATVRKNFAANSSAEILPITDEYNQAKVFSIIWLIVRTVVIGLIVIAIGFFGFRRFVKWYKTDEREQFEKERSESLKQLT
ncbi:hypothetical protein KC669_01930 [Candidatus Dojkabacteria bacterium]|uniref:CopC domain-containing protein n=1 Tax=Candidatus Dojkabacteria bacterium TaxID=2099670 RepID=A0A955RL77_9BACT|nr:hypothetical protein [Candidatus Dojkabacteria bacterium]